MGSEGGELGPAAELEAVDGVEQAFGPVALEVAELDAVREGGAEAPGDVLDEGVVGGDERLPGGAVARVAMAPPELFDLAVAVFFARG